MTTIELFALLLAVGAWFTSLRYLIRSIRRGDFGRVQLILILALLLVSYGSATFFLFHY